MEGTTDSSVSLCLLLFCTFITVFYRVYRLHYIFKISAVNQFNYVIMINHMISKVNGRSFNLVQNVPWRDISKFLILLATWEWTNMLASCKCMFLTIAAIQNNEKYCDICFDRPLSALLCVVWCDQGSIGHVCCCSCYKQQQQSGFPDILTISHKCYMKYSPYI